ncbi:MAG: hypothetical protein JRH18_05090 [Deltaproteobacteria bacterium]|nr:hypothetical protein [Deltaproteobacteria bacterium]MBW1961703.1 hypothetical protein [Deltaproteobacteria bacterium]MBW1993460.1 hypothetical protein [Deltaproteobacteria bacterium]MBW2151021.1 hypothetical protein [Deltaproteobacteria bacterium]
MAFGEPKSVEEKIKGYQKFWKQQQVLGPLIGFDVGGFFPFKWFKALRTLKENDWLLPEQLMVEQYLDDYTKLYKRSSSVNDDLIKGVSPIPAIPWAEAMLGCPVEISGESIWGRERNANWKELEDLKLDDDNKWFQKYLEFLAALVKNADGEYPVSQPILRGVTDLVGALRGNNQALIDTMETPDKLKRLAGACTDALIKLTRKQYDIIQPFYGGFLIEQFGMWAPDKIVRLQEDVSAVYSPDAYCRLIQEYDRDIAGTFPYCLMHLHNSSLFLLDYFLEIEEIDVFQINRDLVGMSTEEMIPYLQKVQDQGRRLLVRGPMTFDDLRLLTTRLSAVGLILQIVLDHTEKTQAYTEFINTLF